MKKVCLISSSGGHFEQLLRLSGLDKDYSVYYVTERTPYSVNKKIPITLSKLIEKKNFY
jgi:Oligosaccharide biosynthesis protein Alg14 like.